MSSPEKTPESGRLMKARQVAGPPRPLRARATVGRFRPRVPLWVYPLLGLVLGVGAWLGTGGTLLQSLFICELLALAAGVLIGGTELMIWTGRRTAAAARDAADKIEARRALQDARRHPDPSAGMLSEVRQTAGGLSESKEPS